MALADLVTSQKGKTVPTVGGSFQVYPLTLEDIGVLLSSYRPQVGGLLGGDIDVDSRLKDAPDFAVDIIALASREPMDMAVKQVSKLPFSTQVVALHEVWGLTVYDPKELMAVINNLLSSMGVTELPTNLKPAEAAIEAESPQGRK